MAGDDRPSPDRARQLTEDLGRLLWKSMPAGAFRIEFHYSQVGRVSDAFADGVVADGVVPINLDDSVLDVSSDLRVAMYRPGAGAWFSAKVTVTAEGGMDADFNYDDEPEWEEGIPEHWFVTDLERFPREDAAMPTWLKDKVAQGSA